MPFYFVLSSTESSVFDFDAPTSAAILGALSGVRCQGGSWIGPGPRVTRRGVLGAYRSWLTTFVWVLEIDGPYSQQGATAAAGQCARAVDQALTSVSSDWSTTTVTPFAEDVNGTLAWWSSGQASVTQTADAFPTGAARLSPDENPVGPTTAATHPPTAGDQIVSGSQAVGNALGNVARPVAQASSSIGTLALVAAGGVALYFAWPFLMNLRGTARTTRRNPARRRF